MWRIISAPHACKAPRKRCCARARASLNWARAAPVSGVRDARCASLLVCAWLQSPRALICCCALPIKERASLASSGSRISRSLHRTLPVLLCFVSALLLSLRLPLGLARFQLLLGALLHCSRLVFCSAFVASSALFSSRPLLCPRHGFRSALVSACSLSLARQVRLQHLAQS